MGNICAAKKEIEYPDEIQSVIFKKQIINKSEILVWNELSCKAYLTERGWIHIPPVDITKPDEFRFHIQKEDIFEKLDYNRLSDGITIVFGIRPVGEPRRRKLMVNRISKRRIHTIHD